MFFFYL